MAWSSVPWRSAAACGRSAISGDVVTLKVVEGEDGTPTAFASGLRRCSSPWLCPSCRPVLATHRGEEISRLASAHSSAETGNGTLWLLSLTMKHGVEDGLDAQVKALTGSWRSLTQSALYRDFRQLLTGFVRSFEVTHGFVDTEYRGHWHAHAHVLLFVKPDCSAQVEAMAESLGIAWANRVERRLGKRPSEAVGLDLRQIGSDAAAYVSKLTSFEGVGQEMTRGDLKKQARDPFSLLDAMGNGEAFAFHRWQEYAIATKGLRAITFSRGLRDAYPDVEELSDDEICHQSVEAIEWETVSVATWNCWLTETVDGVSVAVLELERIEDEFVRQRMRLMAPPP